MKIKNVLNCIISGHKFFVKETPKFIKVWNYKLNRYEYKVRDWAYYPIAYIKFMSFVLIDIFFAQK